MTTIERRTSETVVTVEMNIGKGVSRISTGVPFLDHMMTALSRYSGIDIEIDADGDLKHHTIEDVAIAVGEAFARTLPAACARYGSSTVPMDEALVQVTVDAGGRPFYQGPLPSSLYDHWMRSFSDNARMTLHIRVLRGRDRHHIVEAAFKALGFALRQAIVGTDAVFSTKGGVNLDVKS
ncbi:MAG: imidazoleglycerol-phosphate dehydratase [Gemmatimonadaceae bacterium]